jgi:phytoene/squalene synthetase
VRRPWLLYQGLATDRDRPDLVALSAIDTPEDFVWAMLPHAARSFAASIVALPEAEARASAVAYLYARSLDTYEDLIADPSAQRAALMEYAARFTVDPPAPAPAIPTPQVADDRDRAHLLLVERSIMVDQVFAELSPTDRQSIVELIAAMADGMAWASATFAEQGGVLVSAEQRARYCRYVIGQPALFVLRLITPHRLTDTGRDDALVVSELIQMANITRDIERDLARGVAYHAELEPWLFVADSSERAMVVADVRCRLLVEALDKIPAYRRLLESSVLPAISRARGSAILMLLFTERYYRSAVVRVGGTPWPGSTSSIALYAKAMVAVFSRRRTAAISESVERHLLAAADELR